MQQCKRRNFKAHMQVKNDGSLVYKSNTMSVQANFIISQIRIRSHSTVEISQPQAAVSKIVSININSKL